ncbi:MAG: hypothetical protein ACYTF1_18215 [Planctomycetota bacterium]|jgi:hypothetical protein
MQKQEGLTPAEQELENALGRLRPAEVSIDRDRMMFRAGQRSIRRGMRVWQGVAAILVVGLGLSLAGQWNVQQDASSVFVEVEEGKSAHVVEVVTVQESTRKLHPQSYLLLQRRVLVGDSGDFNWDALNGHSHASQREVNRLRDWRKQL